MPVKGLTQAAIDEATRAQVAAGAKSTDRANRLPGETATEANARITAAYKEMTAKPILSQEQIDAGAQVKFVRTAAGGVGENMVIVPIGYDGPPVRVTEFTPGVIPANSTRITGTSLGFNPDDYKDANDLARIQAKIASGSILTPDEQTFMDRVAAGYKPIESSAPTGKTYSSAELQDIITKLSSGGTLTADERAAIGMGSTPTPAPTQATTSAPTATTAPTGTYSAQELQRIIAKLTSGGTLTNDEKAAIGMVSATTTPAPGATTTPVPGATTTPRPGATTTPIPRATTTPIPGATTTPIPGATTTPKPGATTTAAPGATTTMAPGATTLAPSLTYKASDGTIFTNQQAYVAYQQMLTNRNAATAALDAENAKNRQSAYDLLYAEFSKYGLGSLVQPLQGLIQSGASPSEFALKLRESDAYQKRFAANAQRVAKGLKAISEAEYIGLEDQYQNILRNAGLPESYWKQSVDPRTGITTQEGFTNFIANDVSALELRDRVATAQERLIYANPEVSIALKTFYPDITNGDLLAYALDPTKGLEQIKRRITAAEIGSSAVQLGLATNVTDAEYLARYGVTKPQAQQGYRRAAEILPTATKLGEIYANQGLGPYTQQTAEQEIFNVPGAAEAAAKRRKLTELETAAFSGRAGMGALARDRAGAF